MVFLLHGAESMKPEENVMQCRYEERPYCRLVIDGLLKKHKCSLEDLIAGIDGLQMSVDMKEQALKMIQERDAVPISNWPATGF